MEEAQKRFWIGRVRGWATRAGIALGLLLIVVVAWRWLTSDPDYSQLYGVGVRAPDWPSQKRTWFAKPFKRWDYRFRPLADFRMVAVVLGTRKYVNDSEADLAPVDLAFGWGRMSDPSILGKISIQQSNRFYYWKSDSLPIPKSEIISCSANMHLIPATYDESKAIKNARPGDLISLDGKLVQVTDTDGWSWRSSLTRHDVGEGACEVVFVERFSILE